MHDFGSAVHPMALGSPFFSSSAVARLRAGVDSASRAPGPSSRRWHSRNFGARSRRGSARFRGRRQAVAAAVRRICRALERVGARGLAARVAAAETSASTGPPWCARLPFCNFDCAHLVSQCAHEGAVCRHCSALCSFVRGTAKLRVWHYAGRDRPRCGMADPTRRRAGHHKCAVRASGEARRHRADVNAGRKSCVSR